jgi:hypothetical protein
MPQNQILPNPPLQRRELKAFSPFEKGEQFRTSEELVGNDRRQRTFFIEATLLLSQI